MDYTSKYKLKKPSYDDFVDIEDINANSDTIDAALSEIEKTSNTALSMASNYILIWISPKDEDESDEEYEDRKNEITQHNLKVLREAYQSNSNNVFITYGRQTLSLSAIRLNNPDTIDGDITYVFIDISEGKIISLEVNYMPYKNEYSQYERQISIGGNVTPVSKTSEMTAKVGIDENGKLWFDPKAGEEFKFTSFTASPSGFVEIGSAVNSVSLNWSTNKKPSEISVLTNLGDIFTEGITSESTSKVFVELNIKSSGWIKLSAKYSESVYQSSAVSITFANRIFMGASADTAISDAMLNGLSVNKLASSRALTSSVTAGAGEYVYYACPVSYSVPTFKVGGFEGGFELINGNYSYTNPSGYTEAYQIWRSVNANLGTITVEVE